MQDAVFTLYIHAACRDVYHGAVTVGDGGDQRAGRGVVLTVSGIGIGDDVTGFCGPPGDGSAVGFHHRNVQTGVCAGRQQVSVEADHAIIPACQPIIIERHSRGSDGQQTGEIGFRSIDHGYPGVEHGVIALDNNLH